MHLLNKTKENGHHSDDSNTLEHKSYIINTFEWYSNKFVHIIWSFHVSRDSQIYVALLDLYEKYQN